MGLLINGQWHDQWYDTSSSQGRFLRKDSAYRNWVTVDGAPGPTGHGGFPAEPGRYHLYVSLACPWPHTHPAVLKGARSDHPTVHRSLAHAGKRLDF
jgi:glutathionyl-hydroquinone reductase